MECDEMAKKSMREKYWSEIDDTERVSRLRSAVKGYEYRIAQLEDRVLELTQHIHDAQGKIAVPLERQRIGRMYPQSRTDNPDDLYF